MVPLTVSVNAPLPAVVIAGERLLVPGSGLFTVKVNGGVDVPPPGMGFETVTAMVPPVDASDAAMAAVTCVPPALTVPV